MRFNYLKQSGLLRCILLLMIVLTDRDVMAQNRHLEIQKKSSYELKGDTLILDELIMHDSSSLILKHSPSACYIKVNKLKIGKQCWIIGSGINGISSKPANDADISEGPCNHGKPGPNGKNGANGERGKNLTLEVTQLESNLYPLLLRLNGGNGGDGGSGGNGGNGSKSTIHCDCHGGSGGNGGNGGNGGAGGTFTFRCAQCPANLLASEAIKFNLHGGYSGYGGEGGRGGAIGSGAMQTSKRGANGKHGERGKNGQEGSFIYNKSGS